jgi:peroxiredoxin Q/BCP
MTRFLFLAAVLAAGIHAGAAGAAAPAGPAVGDAAPDFRLQDQKGEWHTLAGERGRWVVLYFYPKDFTPGCTTEVCTFRDDIVKLRRAGADVLGVSLDDVKSHAEFADKYHVPFRLLSDADGSTAEAYGVLTSRGGMRHARRETFLIDPQGTVVRRYVDVDPEKNSGQVLADLATLRAGD